ncbi:DUF1972 domain-containing protein [Escherichia coli]|uniref:DUF1972 domain-containing protein n=1 Tax=Escherichia coli TaxID=562 RepID=UPI0040558AF6
MKKIAIIGTVGIPASYGGFETLVENLTRYNSSGVEYNVFCSSFHYKSHQKKHNGARLIYIPLKANGWQSIAYDIISLAYSIFLKPDVILILGVSGCSFLPFFKLLTRAKFIMLNLQSKCNKKRSTHQLEYNFVSTQKPFPNDEYFLPTSYNKRARKDNDFTRTGQKTSRNCQSTGT